MKLGISLQILEKCIKISLKSVTFGADLFHMDGRKMRDRQEETNNRYSQFCGSA
jgi:hypothetical protein